MAKDATVSARIDENIKSQAEDILRELGIPVSMALTKASKTIEGMTPAELDAELQHSYDHASARKGRPLHDVFADIERKHA
ncbi:MAG: type II toxin-antitoxin system RelB/DinJ family antitoxin [Clostridia bacterium]|nr:type II toxin-antitoxin system RelB/DinJ family antitoxin [Clostridia bacterium]